MARSSKQRGNAQRASLTLFPSPAPLPATDHPTLVPEVHRSLLRQMTRLPLIGHPTPSSSDKDALQRLQRRSLTDTITFSLPGKIDKRDLDELPTQGVDRRWQRFFKERGRPLINRELGIRVTSVRAPDGAAPVPIKSHYGNSEGEFFEVQFSVPRVVRGHNDDVTGTADVDLPDLLVFIATNFFEHSVRRHAGITDLTMLASPCDVPGLAVTRIDLAGDLDCDVHEALNALRCSRWLRSRRPASETENYPSLLFRKGKGGTGGSEDLELYDLGQRQLDKPNDKATCYHEPGLRMRVEMRAKHGGPLGRMAAAVGIMAGSRSPASVPVWIGGYRSEPRTAPLALDWPALHAYFAMSVSGLCRSAGKVPGHALTSVEGVGLEALADPENWPLVERFRQDTAKNAKLKKRRDRILAEAERLRRRHYYPDILSGLYDADELAELDRMRIALANRVY